MDHAEIYAKWKRLVNLSLPELKKFYHSADGRDAGLSQKEADLQGIKSGRESARALMRMIPCGRSLSQAQRSWSEEDWEWAKRQVAFITRMRKVPGPLYRRFPGEEPKRTRKLKALLIWGHDPEKPLRNPEEAGSSMGRALPLSIIGAGLAGLLIKK